jgi:hypothetical protein
MRMFDEWRDGANADQLEMLRKCIDANKHCMGSGWLDVHQFLDWMCEHPGLVCPKERGSGLQDALSAAAASPACCRRRRQRSGQGRGRRLRDVRTVGPWFHGPDNAE